MQFKSTDHKSEWKALKYLFRLVVCLVCLLVIFLFHGQLRRARSVGRVGASSVWVLPSRTAHRCVRDDVIKIWFGTSFFFHTEDLEV